MVLEPIAIRQGANSTVRKRDRTGAYTYQRNGSIGDGKGGREGRNSISPKHKQEMERKQQIQEKIAEFRLIRFQKEHEKVKEI